MANLKKRVFTAALGAALALSSAAPMMPMRAYAEEIVSPGQVFEATKQGSGEVIPLKTGTTIEVYKNADKTEKVDGSISFKEGAVVFTANAPVDSEDEFYFSIKAEGYKEYFGGPFTFAEKGVNLVLEKEPGIAISFDNNEVKNGKYFKKDRKMTLSVEGKEFDENNLTISITVDGKAEIYTIPEIKNGDAESVYLASDRVDSEENEPSYTGDRTNTYVIGFGAESALEEHEYKVTPTYEGYNVRAVDSEAPFDFVVDEVAPVLSASYENEDGEAIEAGSDAGAPAIHKGSIAATLHVAERNFAPAGVDVNVRAANQRKEELPNAYPVEKTEEIKTSVWAAKGDTHSYKMSEFSNDANYALGFEFEDLAGNKATYTPHFFTVDKTPATGTMYATGSNGVRIEYSRIEGVGEDAVKFIYEMFDKGEIKIDIEAEDETSGVDKVQFYKFIPSANTDDEFDGLTKEQLAALSWEDWSEDIKIEPGTRMVLYAKIKDMAGNVTYISSKGGMISDGKGPNISDITLSAAGENGIYTADIPVAFSVEDADDGGAYTGLKNVTVQVLKNEEITQEEEYNYLSADGRKAMMTGAITVNAGKNNSNDVVIRVTATDYAGNQSVREKQVAIDTKPPVIEVVYDNNSPNSGVYYNATRTATVKVYDQNFSSDGVEMNITGSGANYPSVSDWQVDGEVATCSITYARDGQYSFEMSASDLAGNKGSYGAVDAFVIDRTKPVISVSFDNNNGKGKYFNASRTATITVTERNFSAERFTAQIAASLRGKSIPAPQIGAWSSNGDVHTATISFMQDGDYSFMLGITDLAGNGADTYSQSEFTIDQSLPVITFGGVADGSANKGVVAPFAAFSDANFDPDAITLTLSGKRHAARNVSGAFSKTEEGGVINLSDFAHLESEDDLYTLTAVSTDAAGNVSTKAITFSVNRFGSNYYFSSGTEGFLSSRYQKKGQDITIYEVNVDEIKERGITLIHNGTAKKLAAGECAITDVTESGDWKKYEYVIKAECFKEEGLYEIVIDTVDAAGNRQDNKLKDSPIEFVVDRTAPSVVITGVEDGQSYGESAKDITFKASDNEALGELIIYVDGKEVAKYDADRLIETGGVVTYTLKEAGKWQTVSAKAIDAAGNEGEEDSVKILVTTSSLLRMFNNIAVQIGLGVLAIGAIAFGFFLAKGKRKPASVDAHASEIGEGAGKTEETIK